MRRGSVNVILRLSRAGGESRAPPWNSKQGRDKVDGDGSSGSRKGGSRQRHLGKGTSSVLDSKIKGGPGAIGMVIFGVALVIGFIYAGSQLIGDLRDTHLESAMPYVLLGIALLVALGFEFVNGFHDTANAVATVIYTHSMEPHVAVVWSGMWNFIGVLVSSGAVAFAIVSLLPVELILQVGSQAGFAMVFALLIAAIIWNLGTWFFGLPASSSHTLIGSIIGVGIANQLMSVKTGTSGVDWAQATNIGKSLLVSPIVGFVGAALLLLLLQGLDPQQGTLRLRRSEMRRLLSGFAPCSC